MKNKKYKLIKVGMTGILISLMITGCAKKIDCKVNQEHIHMYINNSDGISKYIEGEKEFVGNYAWTEYYEKSNQQIKIAAENNLCFIKDNIDYLKNKFPTTQRQSYSYSYIYGTYYGYGYGFNPINGKFEYCYGFKTGGHYDWSWIDISDDEYTDDKVRDITYKIKLYKISNDGKLEYKLFDSLEDIDEDYICFDENDVFIKNISEEYHLEKEKTKLK